MIRVAIHSSHCNYKAANTCRRQSAWCFKGCSALSRDEKSGDIQSGCESCIMCRGRANNCIRIARQRVERAMQYQYRDRRTKKRDFRTLWIQRINAGTKEHGVSIFLVSWCEWPQNLIAIAIHLHKATRYGLLIMAEHLACICLQ